MADILHQITIKASPEKVFKAITEQRGLAGWWTRDTISAKPETGFVNTFKFDGANSTEMKIINLVPNKRVEWKCLKAEGLDEWVGTKIIFDLEEKDSASVVHFKHADWKTQTDLFSMFQEHWEGYMKSLKAFCETGKGNPFPYK